MAHVGIDVLGDYLVRDDAYDHVSHASRMLVSVIAVLLGSGVLVRAFGHMCDLARQQRYRTRMARASRRAASAVAGTILGATLAIVPAMELLDILRAGSDLDDLGDLFGGSLLLGLSVTIACAVLAIAAFLGLIGWICAHTEDIAGVLATLLAPKAFVPAVHLDVSVPVAMPLAQRHASRRAQKRAPPTRFVAGIS